MDLFQAVTGKIDIFKSRMDKCVTYICTLSNAICISIYEKENLNSDGHRFHQY